jgi:uncharacterized protein YlxP (DUF503 family)
MSIGLLSLHLRLPGCGSLKEKRSRLKPLLARLHREFNVSAAEVDFLDKWQETLIACAVVSNDTRQNQRLLQHIIDWVERNWPDVDVIAEQMEMI